MKRRLAKRRPIVSAVLASLTVVVLGCSSEPAKETSAPLPSPPAPAAAVELSPGDRAMLERLTALHAAGSYDQGVAEAQAYLAEHPEALRVHYALGSLRGSLQDHRGAIVAFEAELARDPGHLGSLRGLATAATWLGDLEASLAPLETVLAARPEDGDATYQLGRNLSALGRFAEAEGYLRDAVRLRPHPNSDFELGLLRRRQGDLAAAEAAFRAALGRDPLHPAALLNLGQVVQRQGRAAEAAALLARHQQAAALADQLDHTEHNSRLAGASVGKLLQLAEAQRRRGFAVAARASLERTLTIDSDTVAAALLLADLALEAADLEAARRWAVYALVRVPESAEARFLLGLARLRGGEREAGEAMLETARAASPWRVNAFLKVGDAFFEIGDLNAARQSYQAARERAPEDARTSLALGKVALTVGEQEEAKVLLKRALALEPTAMAWLLLAVARWQGDPEAATTAFEEARTLHRSYIFSAEQLDATLAPLAELPGGVAVVERYRAEWAISIE